MAKILYGLLVRELFLLVDRTSPDEGTILEPDDLRELRLHHLLLQAARGLVTWEPFPASIILIPTKVSDEPAHNFDFADAFWGPTLTMRLGPIGILAVLQDGGAFEKARFPRVEQVRDHVLAPLQFRELMAFTRYATSKYRLNPGIVVANAKTGEGPVSVICAGSMAPYAYDAFVLEEMASILAVVMNLPIEQVRSGDLLMTWLVNEDGPIDVPFYAAPGPPP